MSAMVRRSRGFTLLESVVAITLLAVMLSALMPVFQQGLAAMQDGGQRSRAVMVAESLLAQAASAAGETPIDMPPQGESDGFRWRVSREPYTEDQIGPIPEDSPFSLVRVVAYVSWEEDTKSIEISTLSLEPRE